jgi:NAD-dependent SIR2 family protein deacetylase
VATLDIEQFVRLYPQRAPRIMWFLGAGASAAAGVPTAGQIVWDLKRQLYCSAQRVSLSTFSDLTNPAVQARVQRYFDDQGGYPAVGDNDEYAFYFERAYPSEADRRSYIERAVAAATPSYGHQALAGLLKMDKALIV